MTDTERLQLATNLFAQRLANATAELVGAQVEAETQKRRADDLQKRLDALTPPKEDPAE